VLDGALRLPSCGFPMRGRKPGGGLVVISGTFTVAHRPLTMSAAARNNVPAVYPFLLFARDSGD